LRFGISNRRLALKKKMIPFPYRFMHPPRYLKSKPAVFVHNNPISFSFSLTPPSDHERALQLGSVSYMSIMILYKKSASEIVIIIGVLQLHTNKKKCQYDVCYS